MTEHTDKLKDVVIKIDGNVVGGCIWFETEESQQSLSIYEYLNSNPYEIIKGKTKYRIILRLTGNSENYSVKEITPCDMFSRTSHIESVCLIVKMKQTDNI